MDFHLDLALRLHTEPEHKSLYDWAINEIGAQDQQIGHDKIPWPWTLDFTATSCELCGGIGIESPFLAEEMTPAPPEIEHFQVIRLRLRPCRERDEGDGDYFRETTFSMFGTDRAIKRFQLDIKPIADPAKPESCMAWGSVSYTAEIDFRAETMDDCIVFYLFVKPETFARYAAKIAHGLVTEMILRVGLVDGFYSEWSPSISTRSVKVLTKGSEQNVALPPGYPIEPPRLGHVGKAELHINRRLEFGGWVPEPEGVDGMAGVETERTILQTQAPATVDQQIFHTLRSLRRAAWSVVSLLALICIVTLLKR